MKLLILSEEVWDDIRYPNNVMTNWFEGFDGQLANMYLAGGMPDNPCCSKYFQITDRMALGNLVRHKSGGKWFISKSSQPGEAPLMEVSQMKFPRVRKGIKQMFAGPLRLLRDAVWLKTRWEDSLLMAFLADFQPDAIFSLRFSSRRMLYLERLLHSATGAPVIAFTGDDEYSLKQINFSPFYWIRRCLVRRDIRRNAVSYAKYYTLSRRQAKELKQALGVNTGVICKGGEFEEKPEDKKLSKPIRMVYAGRLYCNRDKTLRSVAKAINRINREEVLVTLEIYTRDTPGRNKRWVLDDGRSVFLKGFVSAKELRQIYKEADIALHAEGFDLKNRLLTRYSFSTKIVDCLASTCAVLAVGPYDNEGIRYLKKNRGAICIGKTGEVYPVLSQLVNHPEKIKQYRRNAWRLGVKAHKKEEIRQRLQREIAAIVENSKVQL